MAHFSLVILLLASFSVGLRRASDKLATNSFVMGILDKNFAYPSLSPRNLAMQSLNRLLHKSHESPVGEEARTRCSAGGSQNEA